MSSCHCHPLYSCYSSCRHCCCCCHPADQAGEDEHVDQKAQHSESACRNKVKHAADYLFAIQKRVAILLQALFFCRAYSAQIGRLEMAGTKSSLKQGDKCHFAHHTGQHCRLRCVRHTNNTPREAAHKQDRIEASPCVCSCTRLAAPSASSTPLSLKVASHATQGSGQCLILIFS